MSPTGVAICIALALGFAAGAALVLGLWVIYLCRVNSRLMDELSGYEEDDDDDDDDPEIRPLVPFSPEVANR